MRTWDDLWLGCSVRRQNSEENVCNCLVWKGHADWLYVLVRGAGRLVEQAVVCLNVVLRVQIVYPKCVPLLICELRLGIQGLGEGCQFLGAGTGTSASGSLQARTTPHAHMGHDATRGHTRSHTFPGETLNFVRSLPRGT